MKKYYLLFMFLLPLWVQATHLVGGCFELKWLGGDNYVLVVKILRDCENGQAAYDNPISVGLYEKNTNIQKQIISISLNNSNIETLKFTGPNCANIVTGCTQVATYTKSITLPASQYASNNGYYFSYQRCCRNNIIANIIQPQDAGMALYAEIPNPKIVKNSTPHFTNNPNTLLCANNLFKYNMNFQDDDGDVLQYSFIEPINGNANRNNVMTTTSGPYPNVVWRNPYSNTNVISGTLPLSINATTGELTCNPNAIGVYVASIRVEEFRFGKKIGEVRLELQFTVTNCPNSAPLASVVTLNNQLISTDTVDVRVPEELCLKIRGMDQTDSIFLRVNSPMSDSGFVIKPVYDTLVEGFKSLEAKFCFQSACEHERLKKPFPVYISMVDNGCPISRNVEATFWIRVNPMPVVNPTDLLCMTLVNDKETYFYYGDSTDPANPYFEKYNIYRGINYQNVQLIDSILSKNLKQYHDVKTPNYSQINYTYFMVGVNKCGRLGPTSDTMGTFEQLKYIPEKQYFKYVTVADNKRLEVRWPPSAERDFAKYFLYRSVRGNSTFELIQTFENAFDTAFTDVKVNVMDTSYCYHLVMKDTCDNIGPGGKIACSMVLKGKSANFMSKINWDDYIGWESGVEQYLVFRNDPANPFSQIAKTDSSLVFVDDQLNYNEGLFRYYIVAKEKWAEVSPYFGAESQSNTVELLQPPIVYIPNAFTANGDGLNDQYKWVPVFVKDFHIEIYNRWGGLIYQTSDKNAPWDGIENGAPATADVYFYRMSYSGWEGSEKYSSGNFTLMR